MIRNSSLINSISYRFRPLQLWGVAAAWVVAVILGLWLIPGSPPFPRTSTPVLSLMVVATLLGVGAAFVAGSDVDPGEAITKAMPRPYWVTILLRLAGWGALSAATILMFTHRTANAMDVDAGRLLAPGFAHLAFAFAFSFAASRVGGSFMGGGSTLGVMTLLGVVTWFMDGWPLRLYAAPGLDNGGSSTEWMFLFAILFLVGVTAVLARSGTRRPLLAHRRTSAVKA